MAKRIEIISGCPGCGKSTRMIQSAAKTPGKYLFAVPTIDLINEQTAHFSELCPNAQTVRIHSENGIKAKVGRQLQDLLVNPIGTHVGAWITQETLLDNDLSQFGGWHVRIDEPPNAIQTGSIRSVKSTTAFMDSFTLEPIEGSSWAQIISLKPNDGWKNDSDDVLWSQLADFVKLANRSSGVFVNASDWEKFGSGKPIDWFSYWSPSALKIFKTAQIAGSSYLTSLGYLASQTFSDKLLFTELNISAKRTHQPAITIRYFTNSHQGSTSFWSQSEGRRCISLIGNWLNENELGLGFWSGNEAVRNSLEHRIPGELASPKLAGLNCFRAHQSCAIFYSAKALPQDNLLTDVFNLSGEDIKRAREEEDIFQFAMRGAIRNSEYSGPYVIYVYSNDQAQSLKTQLSKDGFSVISIEPIEEAEIMDYQRMLKTKKKLPTQIEISAKKERKKELGRLRVQKHRAKKKSEQSAQQDK